MSNGKKSTGRGTGGVFAVIAIIMLLNLIADGAYEIAVPLIIAAAVVIAAVGLVKAYKKKNSGEHSSRNKEESVTDREYVPVHEEPAKQYYDSSDVFDNSLRDKERRIRQLKVFLKNGIIDKDEYNVLLYRYENDI